MTQKQQEKIRYGNLTQVINQKIKNGGAPSFNKNKDVRDFALQEYKASGLKKNEIKKRMNNKDAGHIIAKNKGGKNNNKNYMWEDRHANRAHGDEPIRDSAMMRAGRK